MSLDKKINVLVTGIGAIIGYGVIKSLRNSEFDCNIVGMDIFEDAVGQHWCDKFIQAKYAVDPDYINFLKGIIDDNDIDIVFFGTEQEIERCVGSKDELGDYYKKLVINTDILFELGNDKYDMCQYLKANDLDEYAIPSVIEGGYDEIKEIFGAKFLLKPRRSYASKGINAVDNKEDFDFYASKMGDNFMAQRLIGDNDHEYTVGVFGYGDGTYAGMIPLKRKLSAEGSTAKAVYFEHKGIEEAVTKMCKLFKPNGPTNFQFREDGNDLYLLEINPRISSSTSIRMGMGYNEAEMCIKYFVLGQKIDNITIKKGRATRFIDEVIVFDE